MSIITLIAMLLVVAVVIKGVMLALAGDWRSLIVLLVCLVLGIWILGFFGVALPNIG